MKYTTSLEEDLELLRQARDRFNKAVESVAHRCHQSPTLIEGWAFDREACRKDIARVIDEGHPELVMIGKCVGGVKVITHYDLRVAHTLAWGIVLDRMQTVWKAIGPFLGTRTRVMRRVRAAAVKAVDDCDIPTMVAMAALLKEVKAITCRAADTMIPVVDFEIEFPQGVVGVAPESDWAELPHKEPPREFTEDEDLPF